MHNLRDLLHPPDAGEVITAEFLQQLADFATRQQIPPNSLVDGTGVYQRLPPVPAPATELVPFRNDDSATVPANGVICCYLTAYPASCPGFGDAANTNWPGWGTQISRRLCLPCELLPVLLDGLGGRILHQHGRHGGLAFQRPVQSRGPQAGHGSLPGRHGSEHYVAAARRDLGPRTGTFNLYRGLPGFVVVGPVDTVDKLAGVMAATRASCSCRRQGVLALRRKLLPRYDRQCWVTCYPMTGPAAGSTTAAREVRTSNCSLNLRRGAPL